MISLTRTLEILATSVLQHFGLHVQKSSKKDLVVELIQLLRPRTVNCELVRIGQKDGDGGYLLPNDLGEISGVFSPGVADNSSFEEFFANLGIPCFLLDGSVDTSPTSHPNFNFRKEWLLGVTEGSFSITLSDWIDESMPDFPGNAILQMDIEGAEYGVLEATPVERLDQFRIIVIELHGMGNLRHEFGRTTIGNVIKKLTMNHDVVHAHPNNCCGTFKFHGIKFPEIIEVTLLHKSRKLTLNNWAEIPNTLDAPNLPGKEIRIVWP